MTEISKPKSATLKRPSKFCFLEKNNRRNSLNENNNAVITKQLPKTCPLKATHCKEDITSVPKDNIVELSVKVHEFDKLRIKFMTAEEILEKACEEDFNNVYELNLHASNLGKIQNLQQFQKLRSLDLSSNFITILENLENNQDLRCLKLYDNKLKTIQNLANLKMLSSLQLQHNKIEKIGDGLNCLVNLQTLRLDFNLLTNLTRNEFSKCERLTTLDLSNNSITNIAALTCLIHLEELYIRKNKISKISDMSRLKNLREFDISDNPLISLDGFLNNTSIQVLSISSCKRINSVKALSKLCNIEDLNVSECAMSSVGDIATQFKKIQTLNISHNQIDCLEKLMPLLSCPELVELNIIGNACCQGYETNEMLVEELTTHLPLLQVINEINVSNKRNIAGTRALLTNRSTTSRPSSVASGYNTPLPPPSSRIPPSVRGEPNGYINGDLEGVKGINSSGSDLSLRSFQNQSSVATARLSMSGIRDGLDGMRQHLNQMKMCIDNFAIGISSSQTEADNTSKSPQINNNQLKIATNRETNTPNSQPITTSHIKIASKEIADNSKKRPMGIPNLKIATNGNLNLKIATNNKRDNSISKKVVTTLGKSTHKNITVTNNLFKYDPINNINASNSQGSGTRVQSSKSSQKARLLDAQQFADQNT